MKDLKEDAQGLKESSLSRSNYYKVIVERMSFRNLRRKLSVFRMDGVLIRPLNLVIREQTNADDTLYNLPVTENNTYDLSLDTPVDENEPNNDDEEVDVVVHIPSGVVNSEQSHLLASPVDLSEKDRLSEFSSSDNRWVSIT